LQKTKTSFTFQSIKTGNDSADFRETLYTLIIVIASIPCSFKRLTPLNCGKSIRKCIGWAAGE
jgi:hypothetical protein